MRTNKQSKFVLSLAICLIISFSPSTGQKLERLSYNNPGLLVDLGVGLWGWPLTNGDKHIRMDLCMITPVAYDFTGNGWPDLVVGDEDGRVALIEHTGKMVDGMPLFLPPRYFRQQADEVKFGVCVTPVGVDWNGNELTDLVMLDHEGYLALFRREKRDDKLVLLPGERVFQIDWKNLNDEPLRLTGRRAGGSGRRKIAIADIDGDGRLDLLLQTGQNSSFFRNLYEVNGITVFRDKGPIDELTLGGHSPSPTVIDLDGDGVPEFLIGAEDGFLYYKKNTFTETGR